MLDVTLSKKLQGRGLGRDLKYALFLFAQVNGVEKINGRNRDRMAKDMLNINLSLGAVEKFYMQEDYPDFEPYRDVIYYTSSTQWQSPHLQFDDSIQSPNGTNSPSLDFCKENLPVMINKVCLSNFVSKSYLENFKYCIELLPSQLQHCYSTSGQSECVDKLVKSLWVKTQKSHKLITFEGHYFGSGSFLARSLSEEDPYFPVKKLPAPDGKNWKEVLELMREELSQNQALGVWLEPVLQKTCQKVPREFLIELKKLCNKEETPLIYNETAAGNFRYGKTFYAANDPEISPDAGMVYLGGQAGIVFLKEKYFMDQPLMMISTWDGDELSLAQYVAATKELLNEQELFFEIRETFSQMIERLVVDNNITESNLGVGFGRITGSLPYHLHKNFRKNGNTFYYMPAYKTMKLAIKEGLL